LQPFLSALSILSAVHATVYVLGVPVRMLGNAVLKLGKVYVVSVEPLQVKLVDRRTVRHGRVE